MYIVKIYLRSIVKDGKNCLALFDSNRNGDINDLKTKVPVGATIIWKLDSCSGIMSITRIYSVEEEHPIFKSDAKRRFLCRGFKLQVPESAKQEEEEKYTIECILKDKTIVVIDPCIRIDPPKLPPPK